MNKMTSNLIINYFKWQNEQIRKICKFGRLELWSDNESDKHPDKTMKKWNERRIANKEMKMIKNLENVKLN